MSDDQWHPMKIDDVPMWGRDHRLGTAGLDGEKNACKNPCKTTCKEQVDLINNIQRTKCSSLKFSMDNFMYTILIAWTQINKIMSCTG